MDRNNNVCSPMLQRLMLQTAQTVNAAGSSPVNKSATKNWRPPWISQSKQTKQASFFKLLPHLLPSFSDLLAPALAVILYTNSLFGDFVHDDIPAITNNPDVNGKNEDVFDLFSNDFWGEPMTSARSHKSYRPLTILAFR